MSDPYEREAARAAIHTLQRELAEVTKQRDALMQKAEFVAELQKRYYGNATGLHIEMINAANDLRNTIAAVKGGDK